LVSALGEYQITITKTDQLVKIADLSTDLSLTVDALCDDISFLEFETVHFGEALETFTYEIPLEHISDDEGESWTPKCGVASFSSTDLPSFCELLP
jgi:hypothetical protein